MASAYGATCHMNKPFSHIYSMDDPRFFFPTTPGDGSILYYSTVYNKWTASIGLTWNQTTGELTAPTFIGSLTGSATLIDTTLTTTNATFFVPFVPLSATQTGGQVLGTDTGLTYNPSTNSLAVVSGSITSDTFVGSLTGSATLIDTTLTTTNATFFIPFVPTSATSTAGQVVGTDAGLTYNPSTNSLAVVNGSITSDTFVGSLTGSATLIDTTLTITDATHFITFVSSSASNTAGQTLRTDAGLTYNPLYNSLDILGGSLVAGRFNITFETTFTATSGVDCDDCFNSSFDNYEIQIRFTAAPTAFNLLRLRLVSSGGVESITGYQGQISTLGSFTSVAHPTSSFSLVNLPSNSGITMSWILYSPNQARTTTISGTNTGSTSASFITVPQIVSGIHTTATAYPSVRISNPSNMSGVVKIRGFY